MTRPRKARATNAEVSDVAWALLTDGPEPAASWETFTLHWGTMHDQDETPGGCPTLRGLWKKLGADIVAQWAEERPGTRPSCWWIWDAPRQAIGTYPGAYYDGKLPEPRQRLGGIGDPRHKVLAYSPEFRLGLPVFVEQHDVDYYNGRTGADYQDGHFKGLAPDPKDPPRFESQATYLVRHGLLLPGERKQLSTADYEPETILG